MERKAAKFAVLSPVLPPYSSGQAVMLERLLRPLSADRYFLVSCLREEIVGPLKRATEELPAPTYRLATFSKPQRFLQSAFGLVSESFRYAADICYRAAQLRSRLKKEGATVLIVCSGDFADMAAAYLVSLTSAIKVVPYMFDYFSYQQTGLFRAVAARLEKAILARAATAIVPNEFMGRELKERYGADSVIIRNPCALPELAPIHPPRKNEDFIILYTGAVYNAHYDAMARLVEALKLVDDPKVQLHIYTSQKPDELAGYGIGGDQVVVHGHLRQEEIPAIQRQASLLFLPLSFESTYEVIIKTSAPGKMGEYLAIARPILAHLPAGSFVEWYLQEHDCGTVVTSTDPADLAAAIRTIREHPDEALRMAAKGREAAERDYALPVVQEAFRKLTERLV